MGEEPSAVEVDVKDLDGFFKKRREEEKTDEEIIREVFESDPTADIKKLEELTGLPSLTIGRIKGQVSIRRKRESRASEKSVEEGEMSEADARQYVAQYGRDGLNKLKRAFLKKTLAIAPTLSEKTAEWILHKWDINARLQDDPNDFYSMLHNDAGLKPNLASSIAKDVFSLEEQYADILEDKGERPIFIRQGSRESEGEGESIAYRRSSGSGPFEVSGGRGRRESDSGGFLTREEYLKLEREKEERRRQEQTEEKRQQREDKFREDITNTLSGFREELEKTRKPSEESSVEEIPIDAQGNPCALENAVTVKKVYKGAGGAVRSDPFDLYLKIRQAEKLDKTGQLDAEGVRRIIKDEVGSKPAGPDPAIAELKGKMEGLSQQLIQRDKEMSEKEKQDLRNQIADMKNDMNRLIDKVSSSGVNSVEGMLSSVGGKLVDKSPIQAAGQIVKDLLTPSGVVTSPEKAPAVTPAAPGAASTILETLRTRGLVTTVRERVVGSRQ